MKNIWRRESSNREKMNNDDLYKNSLNTFKTINCYVIGCFIGLYNFLQQICIKKYHCVKCVQIRSFFWSVFSRIWTEYGEILYLSVFSPNAGKYGPEKTYLDTFHTVYFISPLSPIRENN